MLPYILLGLLGLFTALSYWQFLGFPLFMDFIFRFKKKSAGKDYSYQPFISIVIPAYNEDKVIKQRIENLLAQDYPAEKFEILVIDSGSTDATLKIAKGFEKADLKVKVLEEGERRGKASAINYGKSQAKGEIVLVTDANTAFSTNVLKEIAPFFRDPEVGAVGGRFVLSNKDNSLVRSSSFYWNLETLMRRGESAFDSACLFHGEINAWRKNIIEADMRALSEDLDMAIRIRRQGYKIVYEPRALAFEAGPTTIREQSIQKKRTAIGTIQSIFKNLKYLWVPRDRYCGIIFPSHKSLQILSPFLAAGALGTFIALLALQRFFLVGLFVLIAAVILSFSFAILSSRLAKVNLVTGPSSMAESPGKLLNLIQYVLLHEYIILLAWRDYILRRYRVTWQKAETTRIYGARE